VLHLGSIGKTTIDVDFSFFFLCAFFVIVNYDSSMGVEYALIWIPVLFISVLIHEFAHAAMIALLGFGSSSIVLGGMGGHTANERMRNAQPWKDLLISLAGPISNFVLAYLCVFLLHNLAIAKTDRMLAVLLPYMVWAGFAWGKLNLIPVPPLDGGHATRSFFSMFLTDRKSFIVSTWIALIVGGGIAVLCFMSRQLFFGFMLVTMLFGVWQRWQYFREHGIPGD